MDKLGTQTISNINMGITRLNHRYAFLIRVGVVFTLLFTLITSTLTTRSPVRAAGLFSSSLHTCQPFTQVNDGAFGMGTGAQSNYAGEEGFEVLVFNGQLYVGQEADHKMYGARLWRTKAGVTNPTSQADWEEVAADNNGKPFGVANITQNDHIDSLAELNGYIYASTANGGSNYLGTRIFRSPTGNRDTWEDAIATYGAGFGDIYNMNFKDMQVFQGYLCGGTQNWATGAQVWCTSNGTTWSQKNIGGFGSPYYNNRTVEIWSGFVYNNALYFGVQNLGVSRSDNNDDVGKLYRTTSIGDTTSWSEVYSGPAGSYRVDILGELNGYLYISTKSGSGIIILRSPNGDSGTWTQVNVVGMDSNPNNIVSVVDNATTYDGGIYIAVTNLSTGFELWRSSGTLQEDSLVDWEQVGSSGLGDTKNIYSQLITFNDYIYAWTSNYTTGQGVLKSNCMEGAVTDTPTPTNTLLPTNTPIFTYTPIPTYTYTPTPTNPPTHTPLPTSTSAATYTPTPTYTGTPTNTPTPTPLPTDTSTAISTPTPTYTDTPTNTPLPTNTSTATSIPTPTYTETPTPTYPDTPQSTSTYAPATSESPAPLTTETQTPQPTDTPTAEPINTPEPTATAVPSPTDIPVSTEIGASSTETSTPTPQESMFTPEPTSTNTPAPTTTWTSTPTGTALATATSTPTPVYTGTPLPTSSPSPDFPPMCPNDLSGCNQQYPSKTNVFYFPLIMFSIP